MKISIYNPRCSYYVGGGEIVPMEQARFLSDLGHEVIFITTKIPGIEYSDSFKRFVSDNKNIKIEFINIPSELLPIYKITPGKNHYRWKLESLRVGLIARDIIKSVTGNNGLCAVHYSTDLIAVPEDIKWVLHLHGYPDKLDISDKIILSDTMRADCYIAVSQLVGSKWEKLLSLKNNKINVIYNGVDTKRFFPLKIPKKFDCGYLGRLIEIKGVHFIIEAIKILKEKNIFVSLAIAGTGPYENTLKLMVTRYELDDRITFLGYIQDEQVNTFYNWVSFMVLPSYDREGVLTTLLESSSCGIPSITTLNTSMAEFVINEVNGLLVNSQDPFKISEAILKFKINPDFAVKLGQESLNMIHRNWTWFLQSKKLADFYYTILHKK